MIYLRYIKRFLDITVSLCVIILMMPLFFIVGFIIKIVSSGPVFFFQTRIGLNGEKFKLVKFRSMTVNSKRIHSQTYTDDPEVFLFGKFLRRTKIDELPQLFNVLIGDMSLVGPRPCLEHTYELMPEWARVRFHVRPGLTGLAQVNGNIKLEWESRWKYDAEYVENISIGNDALIFFKTFLVVLLGEERFGKRA